MQASTQTRKVKHQRPNLVTAPELNALIGELKAEMAQLKHQVRANSQLRSPGSNSLSSSSRVQGRLLDGRQSKQSRTASRAGTSIEDAKTMLGDSANFQMLFQGTDKQQAIEGILKIALIQAGKRS